MDEIYSYPGCGTEYHWLDLHSSGDGLYIRFIEGRVFQIEAATPRYSTKGGITRNTSPGAVKKLFPHLRTYVLYGTADQANQNHQLIFWVGEDEGIAFSFAYSGKDQAWGVEKVIIFNPKSKFCPDGQTLDSPNWKQLSPYSLSPPNRF